MLVTKKAPDFTAAAVLGNGEIVDNFNLLEKKVQFYSFIH